MIWYTYIELEVPGTPYKIDQFANQTSWNPGVLVRPIIESFQAARVLWRGPEAPKTEGVPKWFLQKAPENEFPKTGSISRVPIGSMYDIFTYICLKFMVNVSKYASPMDPMGLEWF